MLLFKLTESDILSIKGEIETLLPKFDVHVQRTVRYKNGKMSDTQVYARAGSLREGRSIWLNQPDKGFLCEFPEIKKIIDRISISTGETRIGRAYIHRLLPGQNIYKHADDNEIYFDDISRYHIYLDLPEGVDILHHGDKIGENEVMLFNHKLPHEYKNNSTSTIYFVVFDLYKVSHD